MRLYIFRYLLHTDRQLIVVISLPLLPSDFAITRSLFAL